MMKRVLAVLLALLMLLSVLPLEAAASLLENALSYNREVLSALEEIVGSEDEAEQYYDLLRQYNLLDEDGQTVESWSVTMDGQPVTLDALREILAGDYAPNKIVWVDGQPVTLENIKAILAIEDYIAQLRAIYCDDGVFRAETEAENVDETAILLAAESPDAVITANGEPVEGYTQMTLTDETNTMDILVTAADGETTC